MPQDVAAVLALTGSWYQYSFNERLLQIILLLKDGRFALLASSDEQGTIDPEANCDVSCCVVADSLLALVAFGQDSSSRRVLKTRLPGAQPESSESTTFSEHFFSCVPPQGTDPRRSEVWKGFLSANDLPGSMGLNKLYDLADFDQDEARMRIAVGDLVKVKHDGLQLSWQSGIWPDIAEGAIDPIKEAELQAAKPLATIAGECFIGQKRGASYLAKVVSLSSGTGPATIDVLFACKMYDGGGSFTGSLGSFKGSEIQPIHETDVPTSRVVVISKNPWVAEFNKVWKRCGSFSSCRFFFGKGCSR